MGKFPPKGLHNISLLFLNLFWPEESVDRSKIVRFRPGNFKHISLNGLVKNEVVNKRQRQEKERENNANVTWEIVTIKKKKKRSTRAFQANNKWFWKTEIGKLLNGREEWWKGLKDIVKNYVLQTSQSHLSTKTSADDSTVPEVTTHEVVFAIKDKKQGKITRDRMVYWWMLWNTKEQRFIANYLSYFLTEYTWIVVRSLQYRPISFKYIHSFLQGLPY